MSEKPYNYYTKLVADYVRQLKYEDLPQEVIEQAKRITMHTLAAAVASFTTEQADRCVRMVERKGGIQESTVWGGSGMKVPCEEAAFANGTMADILDWEDCAWTGHPSAGAIPAALAVGEALHSNGKELIEAIVAAYEAYHRIAMSAQPTPESRREKRRMWGLVSWQIYSASLAAAKLMKLDDGKMMQTIGASYYQTIAPGTKHNFGTATSDIYHFAHGFCARNGVVAAQIADIGYDNCYNALDGFNGYWNQVSDRVDWEWYGKELGTKYYIMETLLKHWPANVWNQGPVECMMRICEENTFDVKDIAKIRISPNVGTKMTGYYLTTRRILDAQFSIPYCICAYLLDHDPTNWFTEQMRNDPTLIALTEMVEGFGPTVMTMDMFHEFQAGDFPEVTIELVFHDGSKISRSLRYPKGHPKYNFTMEEECEHFRARCKDILPERQTEAIIDMILHMEDLTDVAPISEQMALCPKIHK